MEGKEIGVGNHIFSNMIFMLHYDKIYLISIYYDTNHNVQCIDSPLMKIPKCMQIQLHAAKGFSTN